MKNKTWIIIFILLVYVLFTMTGCSNNNSTVSSIQGHETVNTVEGEQAIETELQTESPLSGKTAEEYVFSEIECQVPYHGGFLITGEQSNDKDTAQCRLPQLNLEIGAASEINQEIHEKLDGSFEYYETIDPSAEYIPVNRVDYLCCLNSSVLSLIIESRSTDTPNSHFYVYNIDVVTGERLDNESLIKLSNVSVNEAYGQLYNVIESKFTDIQGDWINEDILERTKNSSLTTSNIESSIFFFNEEGKLSAAFRYDWFAGAGNEGDVCVLDASIEL